MPTPSSAAAMRGTEFENRVRHATNKPKTPIGSPTAKQSNGPDADALRAALEDSVATPTPSPSRKRQKFEYRDRCVRRRAISSCFSSKMHFQCSSRALTCASGSYRTEKASTYRLAIVYYMPMHHHQHHQNRRSVRPMASSTSRRVRLVYVLCLTRWVLTVSQPSKQTTHTIISSDQNSSITKYPKPIRQTSIPAPLPQVREISLHQHELLQ
jgi:hypothetical protein